MTEEKPQGKGKKIRLIYFVIAAVIVFIAGFSQDCPTEADLVCKSPYQVIFLGVVFAVLLFILLIVFSIYRNMTSTGIVDSKLPARDLGVGERDIKNIRKAGVKVRILQGLIAVLLPLLYFIVFRLGVSLRLRYCTNMGYPFACSDYGLGLLMIPPVLAGKKKSSRITALLISAIVFLIALNATPVFGQQTIIYNVHYRDLDG